jgi:hypothetical protein
MVQERKKERKLTEFEKKKKSNTNNQMHKKITNNKTRFKNALEFPFSFV